MNWANQCCFLRLSSWPQLAPLVVVSVCSGYMFIYSQLSATFSNLEPNTDFVTCFRFGMLLSSACGCHGTRPLFPDEFSQTAAGKVTSFNFNRPKLS